MKKIKAWDKLAKAKMKLDRSYPGVNAIVAGIQAPESYGDKLQTLEEERAKIYGDPFLSHQAIGLAWEGILRNRYHALARWLNENKISMPDKLFPADLVAEFLAAFKIVRLTRPVYHQDSADDAKVYIGFSERFRTKK